MYAREEWRVRDPERLARAVAEIHLCTLVVGGAEPEAVHAPAMLTGKADGGELETHVARANPIWRAVGEGARGLALFRGPSAYIRPGWYETKRETGKAVPTWTYVAVTIRGALRAETDPDWLRAHVARLSAAMEAGRPEPWSVAEAPEGYIVGMARGIVGLRLSVERMEGVWKMNQHRSEADRAGAAAGLMAEGGPEEAAAAAVMRSIEDGRG